MSVTVSTSIALLPALSVACTVIVVVPICTGTFAAVQAVVPVAVPLAPRSVNHVTDSMLPSSAAVPASVMNGAPAVNVGSPVGAVIVTVGDTFGASLSRITNVRRRRRAQRAGHRRRQRQLTVSSGSSVGSSDSVTATVAEVWPLGITPDVLTAR